MNYKNNYLLYLAFLTTIEVAVMSLFILKKQIEW